MGNDIWHEMGNDLQPGPTGDLAIAKAPDSGRQRVLRRLLTNAGDYTWHLSYGAGLPSFVGQVVNVQRITAVVRVQMMRERAVLQTPTPTIGIRQQADQTTVTLSISYVDAPSGQRTVLGAITL